jgi:hypothetical protein
VVEKFRQAGLEVRVEDYPLNPRVVPQSWNVSVAGGGKTLELTSASPIISFATYIPSPAGEMDLDTEWVGLGMASDFLGKDVRDKAVFIYSVPTPSSLIQTAAWMGGAERAQKGGAKALFVVLAIPGNLSFVSHLSGARLSDDLKIPIFTVGLTDGEAVESLHAASSAVGVKTHVRWETETVSGRGGNVIGLLRGQTDESIVTLAHTDGFFEGALDDAAGTAALIGTAEYFSKIPREQRRRNMYFIAVPDHHGGNLGGAWIHEHMQDVLNSTAVILNVEHVGAAEPVWDRPWGSGAPPGLVATNQLASSWWGVYGSQRLGRIVRDAFAMFGVPTQIEPGGSAGQLRSVQWDAPSFYLHNKNIYYHASNDTPDAVVATGLRTAVQAFVKVFDDVNALELDDLRPSNVGSGSDEPN